MLTIPRHKGNHHPGAESPGTSNPKQKRGTTNMNSAQPDDISLKPEEFWALENMFRSEYLG